MFLGSSCIYPKEAGQPIPEAALLNGPLEPTNKPYALAKIAGLEMCAAYRRQYGCDFISAMPCNLYGPGDKFDAENSHVIPALMLKMHKAKMDNAPTVELWGTGTPLREFLYAPDLADGLVFILKNYSGTEPVNIGSGIEVSIRTLAEKIAAVVDYKGLLIFNTDKPDGTMRKLIDSSQMQKAGWQAKTSLDEGLQTAYDYFRTVHS